MCSRSPSVTKACSGCAHISFGGQFHCLHLFSVWTNPDMKLATFLCVPPRQPSQESPGEIHLSLICFLSALSFQTGVFCSQAWHSRQLRAMPEGSLHKLVFQSPFITFVLSVTCAIMSFCPHKLTIKPVLCSIRCEAIHIRWYPCEH